MKVKLVDGSFLGLHSFACAGECKNLKPQTIEWDREPGPAKTKVFTDGNLDKAAQDDSPRKIALLIEPPAIRPGIYEQAWAMRREFHTILTHQRAWCDKDPRYKWYPYGGTWIRDENWGIKPKGRQVSILVSQKTGQEGHRLRHEAKKLDGVDGFGRGCDNWVSCKMEALAPYRYSIVIENSRSNYYFTEKLIDCLSQGTVPIYWGGDIGPWFNRYGVICFDALEELPHILGRLSEWDYLDRMEAIRENYRLAQSYRCPEDWITWRYPGLLDG